MYHPANETTAAIVFAVLDGFVSELSCRRLQVLIQKNFAKMRRSGPQVGDLTLLEQHLLVSRLLGVLLEGVGRTQGLTFTQVRILACIHRLQRDDEPLVVPAKIGEETGYSKAHVSEALGSLQELGLLTREQSPDGDRRMTLVALTERGVKAAARVVALMLPVEMDIRDKMRVAGRSALLDKLAVRLAEKIDNVR